MLRLIGQQRGEFFSVECSDCECRVRTTAVESDGVVPRVRFDCPKCQQSIVMKLAPESWPWLVEGR